MPDGGSRSISLKVVFGKTQAYGQCPTDSHVQCQVQLHRKQWQKMVIRINIIRKSTSSDITKHIIILSCLYMLYVQRSALLTPGF